MSPAKWQPFCVSLNVLNDHCYTPEEHTVAVHIRIAKYTESPFINMI